MPSISQLDPIGQQDLIERLKRIEGQARGVQKMITEGRDCHQIMNQVAAIKAATHALSGEMLEQFARYCMTHPDDFPSREQAIAQMVSAIVRGAN